MFVYTSITRHYDPFSLEATPGPRRAASKREVTNARCNSWLATFSVLSAGGLRIVSHSVLSQNVVIKT